MPYNMHKNLQNNEIEYRKKKKKRLEGSRKTHKHGRMYETSSEHNG